jgi:hypothetical protein
MKIDLGCGNSKIGADFVGVDRYQIPGVDVIADIDSKLPLEDNSVDFLFASHSLEHCANLTHTIKEIYRICRHGAQVCIISPYYATDLNVANPYHLQCFNEHTARFWTAAHFPPNIPVEEWEFPHAGSWSLGASDHSDPGMDLRCVRLEFFYFPEFRSMAPTRLRRMRRQAFNVCDQIMYHLVVIKRDCAQQEYDAIVENMNLFDAPYIAARRENETGVARGASLRPGSYHVTQYSCEKAEKNESAEQVQVPVAGEQVQKVELFLEEVERARLDIRQEMESLKSSKLKAQIQLDQQREFLAQCEMQLKSERSANLSLRDELRQSRRVIDETNARIREFEVALRHNEKLRKFQDWSLKLAAVARTSQNRPLRVLQRIFERGCGMPSVWSILSPEFDKLKDESKQMGWSGDGWGLAPSENLQEISYRSYQLNGLNRSISRIHFAPVMFNLPREGALGVEIVSPDQAIVASAFCSTNEMFPDAPCLFRFGAVQIDARPGWELRVFAKNFGHPVQVLEFRRHLRFGLRGTAYRPFCALEA